jgi:single-strand selective monofunctional uracil DNA glycosylase
MGAGAVSRSAVRRRAATGADASSTLLATAARLADAVDRLEFAPPVTHVYNPLRYAWEPYRSYLERFGGPRGRTVLVGMNPGPFGMAQTGIPFGDVAMVRDWMGIGGPVGRPAREHPQRPVRGFDCPRSEVSGTRLWGWVARRFGSPEEFFRRFLVVNYCPLAFLEASGRNRTPVELPASERTALYAACDPALRAAVEALEPRALVGVGRFAADRAAVAATGLGIPVGTILHPSPANPGANRDWEPTVERQLGELGVL